MIECDSVPLGDEQVQRYIADGFIVLDSGLPADFHADVVDELHFAMQHETPLPGDNLLPRIPAMERLLSAPTVRGAMESLLGPEFAWAPHRFPHNSEPLANAKALADAKAIDPFENQPAMGRGSISGSGWHQDGHSRAGRSRWHTFRAANLFYFPQETPLEMGPTRLLAGSHLYANLAGVVREQVFMRHMPAGSVVIADFDLGHAGAPNRTAMTRYMLKFVGLRLRNPMAAAWDHRDPAWRTPSGLHTPHTLPQAWTSLWNWLRGASRTEGVQGRAGAKPAALVAALAAADQGERLAALYDLVAIGDAAVPVLVEALVASAGCGRHVSPPQSDPAFHGEPQDHRQRGFSHRQFIPEDSAVALGAIGEPALADLLALLAHDDPWIRMNAAYAIGEADPAGVHGEQVGALLDETLDAVVRVAIDALCCQDACGPDAVRRLHRLLADDVAAWHAPAMGAQWCIRDQIRYVAAWALTACASGPRPGAGVEAALMAALGDDTGYTPAVACEGLKRLATPAALMAAIGYLRPIAGIRSTIASGAPW